MKLIRKIVAELIAVDNQPFSIVDDVRFNCLIHHLEPRYNVQASQSVVPFRNFDSKHI